MAFSYSNNNLSNTVKISPSAIKNAIIAQGNVQNRLFDLGVTLSDGTIAYLNVEKDTARTTTYKDGTWTDLYTLATKSDLPQSGRTPLIDCRSNAITEFKVTFPKVFSKAPAIIVTPSSGTPGISGIPKYSAWDVTTTGFTIRIYNEDSEQRSPAFYWTAMAKS